MDSFLTERIFRSTPNGVLTAHTEWLPGVTEAFSTICAVHIEDCEGWCMVVRLSWLSGRALAGQARGVLGSTPGLINLDHRLAIWLALFRVSSTNVDVR